MLKSLSPARQVMICLLIGAITLIALMFMPTEALPNDLGLIVGAQHDGYKIGATIGMIKTMSPQLSLFFEGAIRDPEWEASARAALSFPLGNQWKLTALAGPEAQAVSKTPTQAEITTHWLTSTGLAISHPISARATGWAAVDWTPSSAPVRTTRIGIGIIAWL